jgi:cold shock CspA family protein
MNREKRPDDLAREAAGEPPEPLRTEATSLGTVKWWKDDKGYGAIACTVTAPWDIWCHFSAIDTSGFKSLTEGETVTVEYCRANQDSFRYIARRVRRIDTPTVPPAR